MASKSGKKSKGKKAALRRAIASKVEIDQPTAEMRARVNYDLMQVKTEMGQVLGLAYRRRPLFETMRTAGAISPDEVDALRFYRIAHDRCEYSPMKSCPNVEHGGGGFTAGATLFSTAPSVVIARRNLRMCEVGIGFALATLRSVALQDRSFSDLAIERHGGREKDGRILPRSGRHRAQLRDEFHAGLRVLTDTVRALTTQSVVEEIWVWPEDDGSASIRRGLVAPERTYRCWGDGEKLDMIMADLRATHGRELRFMTPLKARAALEQADAGRLWRLEEDELAT